MQTCMQVITQRAMNDRKAEYPHLDESVFRLEHIGKEAVKKLQNLNAELSKLGGRTSLASVRTGARHVVDMDCYYCRSGIPRYLRSP